MRSTTRRWTCKLEGWFPTSPNQRRGKHWSFHHRDAKRVDEYLLVYARPTAPRFAGPVRVTIVRVYDPSRDRAFDLDNLLAGAKHLVDGLSAPRGRKRRGLGVFGDDDQEHIVGFTTDQRRIEPGELPGTIITVEPVDEAPHLRKPTETTA